MKPLCGMCAVSLVPSRPASSIQWWKVPSYTTALATRRYKQRVVWIRTPPYVVSISPPILPLIPTLELFLSSWPPRVKTQAFQLLVDLTCQVLWQRPRHHGSRNHWVKKELSRPPPPLLTLLLLMKAPIVPLQSGTTLPTPSTAIPPPPWLACLVPLLPPLATVPCGVMEVSYQAFRPHGATTLPKAITRVKTPTQSVEALPSPLSYPMGCCECLCTAVYV